MHFEANQSNLKISFHLWEQGKNKLYVEKSKILYFKKSNVQEVFSPTDPPEEVFTPTDPPEDVFTVTDPPGL